MWMNGRGYICGVHKGEIQLKYKRICIFNRANSFPDVAVRLF